MVAGNSFATTNQQLSDLAYDAIIEDTYFEDEGYERVIAKKNFQFNVQPISNYDVEIVALGEGYSAWDDKIISYNCRVLLNVESTSLQVKKIDCLVEGENWPFY